MTFSREEHMNWLSSANQSALKTHIQRSLFGLNSLYLGIHTYIHIYTRNLGKYICIYACDNNYENMIMHLKESGEEYIRRFGERKGRENCC